MGKRDRDLQEEFGGATESQKAGKRQKGLLGKPTAMHHYQEPMIDALYDRNMELAALVGAAGTGKTFLAVHAAVDKLQRKEIRKIILTRPAKEAGENLGFLPGDMNEKVAPYMQPFFDIFEELDLKSYFKNASNSRDIEVAPVAFMRGRTLSNAMIIVDEAQNLTAGQLDMVTTRIGYGSKMVICGDPRQSDLTNGARQDFSKFIQLLEKYNIGNVVKIDYSVPTCRASIVQQIQAARESERLENEPPTHGR